MTKNNIYTVVSALLYLPSYPSFIVVCCSTCMRFFSTLTMRVLPTNFSVRIIIVTVKPMQLIVALLV